MQPTKQPSRAEGTARVRQEGPITLVHAASVFPRGERWKSVSVKSLRRWIIGGKSGIRLESCRVNGELHTSVAAIGRFVEALGEVRAERSAA